MRKIGIVIAAAVTALGATVGMAHGTPNRFVRDGVTYEYTAEAHNGRQVINGRRVGSSSTFHLVVENGRVHGVSGGMPVAFDVADVNRAPLQIAAR